MNILRTIAILSCFSILASCDKLVGENGVVEDAVTGERLQGVTVEMTSGQGNRTDTSGSNGYFNVIKNFSCGIASCDSDYRIKFTKENYDTLTINEHFYTSDLAEYVNPEKKDTLIIKLSPRD